jgi:hypothetical protein
MRNHDHASFLVLAKCLLLAIGCLSCGNVVAGEGASQKEVGSLVADLTNNDVRLRSEAAQALGALKDQRAIPALIKACRDTRYESFLAALEAIGEYQDDRVQPLLLDALQHEDWRARGVAARLLDRRGWEPANREQRIRRLVALEKWPDARATGLSATSIPGRQNVVEGAFELDIPVIIVLEPSDPQEPKITAYPWVEFHKTNDQVQATAELLVASWPKSKCSFAITILGEGAAVLSHAETVHTNSGVLEKYVGMERERLHFAFASPVDLRAARCFQFRAAFEKAD